MLISAHKWHWEIIKAAVAFEILFQVINTYIVYSIPRKCMQWSNAMNKNIFQMYLHGLSKFITSDMIHAYESKWFSVVMLFTCFEPTTFQINSSCTSNINNVNYVVFNWRCCYSLLVSYMIVCLHACNVLKKQGKIGEVALCSFDLLWPQSHLCWSQQIHKPTSSLQTQTQSYIITRH